jgi:hypothetical protein
MIRSSRSPLLSAAASAKPLASKNKNRCGNAKYSRTRR